MKRLACWMPLALVAMVLASGCQEKPRRPRGGYGGEEEEVTPRKPIKFTQTGTIKGHAVLQGDRPDMTALNAAFRKQIEQSGIAHCLAGTGESIESYSWRFNQAGRLQYVFVWIRPVNPRAEFFDVEELVKAGKYPQKVTIDQPHCAFLPHGVVLFPQFARPKGFEATRQEFIVKNSSGIDHNANYGTDNKAVNKNSELIIPNTQLTPSYTRPIVISCNIHSWMRAYAWAFEHPFAAVTNENGEYEIKGVPAGIPVRLVAWHEVAGFLLGDEGKEITVPPDGVHTENLNVQKKD